MERVKKMEIKPATLSYKEALLEESMRNEYIAKHASVLTKVIEDDTVVDAMARVVDDLLAGKPLPVKSVAYLTDKDYKIPLYFLAFLAFGGGNILDIELPGLTLEKVGSAAVIWALAIGKEESYDALPEALKEGIDERDNKMVFAAIIDGAVTLAAPAVCAGEASHILTYVLDWAQALLDSEIKAALSDLKEGKAMTEADDFDEFRNGVVKSMALRDKREFLRLDKEDRTLIHYSVFRAAHDLKFNIMPQKELRNRIYLAGQLS